MSIKSLGVQGMAEIVSNDCLRYARDCSYKHSKGFISYLIGKADSAAFIFPSEATLAAENEIRFLEKYYQRHAMFWEWS